MKRAILFTIICAFFFTLSLFTCSCKKEKECGKVIMIVERFNTKKVKISEMVIWRSESVICGQQFNNFKIQEARDTAMVADCVNGIPVGYKRTRVITE